MKANASSKKESPENLLWSGYPHLINSAALSKEDILYLLMRASYFKQKLFVGGNNSDVVSPILLGKSVANLFYENSTRTRLSFELASKHLGMHVLNLDVSRSSVQKGESLEDTARTLAAMGVNVIVQRHSLSGSAEKIAEATNNKVHIINAGEGTTDHPTQALLDIFTMLEANPEQKDLANIKIVIVGDILHSRVASANLSILPLFGAKVHLVGPAQLIPQKLNNKDVTTHTDLAEALVDADFVMCIRPQFERQENGVFGSVDNYISDYQINHQRLKHAKPSVKVCAPGPINRNIEISNKVADDCNLSLIEKQVRNGVPIRMAVIEALCKVVD